MNLTKINETLKDLRQLRYKNKPIEVEVIKEILDEEQGAEGLCYEVYKLPTDDLFVRLTINTDSYGEEEYITGIEFVKPIEKLVTKFETI